MAITARRRIWGWFFFFWAAQPYFTLLLTFIFGPYVASLYPKGTEAQTVWGNVNTVAGLMVALAAPFLGAVADKAGGKLRFIAVFSLCYVAGAGALWFSAPASFSIWFVSAFFALGLIATELAAMFANAMLPDLGPADRLGRISGSGWAFGYLGGVVALVVMLALFVEQPNGLTLLGRAPALGLDAASREGTRFVGPFVALWYLVFILPFFLWSREPRGQRRATIGRALAGAWPELRATLADLPRQPALLRYLVASMLYRDGLNGMFVFGGIYATGVLGLGPVDIGIFGIIAAVSGALFAWLGGKADSAFGPKPVIVACLLVLALAAAALLSVTGRTVLGMDFGPAGPRIAFDLIGVVIGAGAGTVQAASRTLMVHLSEPGKMTESFGLYQLAGNATTFIAPFLVSVATAASGSQQIGIAPIIGLFLLGLWLLRGVPNFRPATPGGLAQVTR
ncbi:MAG: MFS transporter [Proteobacteria bacterium]|nr:MFS transporter [Pseudomonadota bacterium]